MPITPEDLYEPYLEHYRYVLRWRVLIVTAWAVTIAALSRALVWFLEVRLDYGILVPAAAAILTFAFWLAERRNRKVIDKCRDALKVLEDKVIPQGIPKLISGDVSRGKRGDRVRTHGFWIDVIMIGTCLLCVAAFAAFVEWQYNYYQFP